MTPVTQMPAHGASQAPMLFFASEPPGLGSAGGGKRPSVKKKPKSAPKKGGSKPSKKKR
jgi:hypothetical protein